ncbi:MAG: SIMPL domain-containing protein [Pseudomonadota bacterium]
MLKTLALALTFTACGASASNLPDYPFVHANGEANTYFIPDRGAIDFEILAYDPNPELARATVAERVAAVRKIMQELAVPDGDVETRDIRKEIRKGTTDYDIKCTVHINVRELARWREIVLPLLDMPNLDGFATSFDSSGRDKIVIELMGAAIKDAQRKAEAMALGVGRKLGAATAVTAGQLKNLSTSMGLVAADFNYTRATGKRELDSKDFLTIDIQKMAQLVDVIFRLK